MKTEKKFYGKWSEKLKVSDNKNWPLENEIEAVNGDFIDLQKNPEAYTGYQGQQIWKAVYDENCLANNNVEELCIEEIVFYKMISGLHSNINCHLSKNYIDFNRNKTIFNISMFNDRIGKHPDRINNLFYLFTLLLKTFTKAELIIRDYPIVTGNTTDDNNTVNLLSEIYYILSRKGVRETCSESSENLRKLTKFNKLGQIVRRFTNISAIFDCVGCEKCKLHGKLQIYGLSTMMKILFDSSFSTPNRLVQNSTNLTFKRNEIIAFVNLLIKVSKSLSYVKRLAENRDFFKIIHKGKIAIVSIFFIGVLAVLNLCLFKRNDPNGDNIGAKEKHSKLDNKQIKNE